MDIIKISKKDNTTEDMEVVATIKKEDNEYNFLIYRTLDKKHYYVAKYIGEDIVNLDTNLTEKEYFMCESYLKGIMEKDVRN